MVGRLAAGGVAFALALAPLPGPGAAAAEPSATAGRGAIVVAIAADAGPPARALGHEVYRDAALRPAIDDATARVLVGEPVAPEAAPPPAKTKLAEMAEIRAAITGAGAEAASRRLIASLGTETGAALVITVTMDAGRPVAKVLQVSSATYAPIELGATIETASDGTRLFQWPGATATLKGLLPPMAPSNPAPAAAAPAAAAPAAAAPKADAPKAAAPRPHHAPPKETKPVWSSPWFWGGLGGVAAVGITVFVLSRVTAAPSTVHLDGRVAP